MDCKNAIETFFRVMLLTIYCGHLKERKKERKKEGAEVEDECKDTADYLG